MWQPDTYTVLESHARICLFFPFFFFFSGLKFIWFYRFLMAGQKINKRNETREKASGSLATDPPPYRFGEILGLSKMFAFVC